jgi:hypothetical protein
MIPLIIAGSFLHFFGGAQIGRAFLGAKWFDSWRTEKAIRKGFNPFRQEASAERMRQTKIRLEQEGIDFENFQPKLKMVEFEISKEQMREYWESMKSEIPFESVEPLTGRYYLTLEEEYLFAHGLQDYLTQSPTPVDFWWLKKVSEERLRV